MEPLCSETRPNAKPENVGSNSKTDQQAIELIEKEFKEKTLGVTEQYLEIHSPIYADNKLKADRIDRDRKDELIIAYLPVLDEKFYFAVYIDTKTNEVTGVGTEAYHRVYFRATSETLSADSLKAMTHLTAVGFLEKSNHPEVQGQEQNEASSARGHTPGPPFCSGLRSAGFHALKVLMQKFGLADYAGTYLLYCSVIVPEDTNQSYFSFALKNSMVRVQASSAAVLS